MVWELLHSTGECEVLLALDKMKEVFTGDERLTARDTTQLGRDHLVTLFQCDLCVFGNLQGRNPGEHDTLVVECIQKVNSDALWGREMATVDSTRRAVAQTVKILKQVKLEPPYPPLEPLPVIDNLGYAIAITMILKSSETGKYAEYQQFESIRKL